MPTFVQAVMDVFAKATGADSLGTDEGSQIIEALRDDGWQYEHLAYLTGFLRGHAAQWRADALRMFRETLPSWSMSDGQLVFFGSPLLGERAENRRFVLDKVIRTPEGGVYRAVLRAERFDIIEEAFAAARLNGHYSPVTFRQALYLLARSAGIVGERTVVRVHQDEPLRPPRPARLALQGLTNIAARPILPIATEQGPPLPKKPIPGAYSIAEYSGPAAIPRDAAGRAILGGATVVLPDADEQRLELALAAARAEEEMGVSGAVSGEGDSGEIVDGTGVVRTNGAAAAIAHPAAARMR